MSIQDDKDELSEFQKSLKYKIVKVGDIVEEVHWIAVSEEAILKGIVIDVETRAYSTVDWIDFIGDRITIRGLLVSSGATQKHYRHVMSR